MEVAATSCTIHWYTQRESHGESLAGEVPIPQVSTLRRTAVCSLDLLRSMLRFVAMASSCSTRGGGLLYTLTDIRIDGPVLSACVSWIAKRRSPLCVGRSNTSAVFLWHYFPGFPGPVEPLRRPCAL